jgi:hypothetical protein
MLQVTLKDQLLNGEFQEIFAQLMPEIHQLVTEWDTLSAYQKGT